MVPTAIEEFHPGLEVEAYTMNTMAGKASEMPWSLLKVLPTFGHEDWPESRQDRRMIRHFFNQGWWYLSHLDIHQSLVGSWISWLQTVHEVGPLLSIGQQININKLWKHVKTTSHSWQYRKEMVVSSHTKVAWLPSCEARMNRCSFLIRVAHPAKYSMYGCLRQKNMLYPCKLT